MPVYDCLAYRRLSCRSSAQEASCVFIFSCHHEAVDMNGGREERSAGGLHARIIPSQALNIELVQKDSSYPSMRYRSAPRFEA